LIDRMSLAARIAFAPSRRIAFVESTVPVVGLVVAATAMLARWPSSVVALLAGMAMGLPLLAVLRRAGRPRRLTMTVADRAEFDVMAADAAWDGSRRLAETTVAWPGFAMLALSCDDGGPVLRLPIVMAELDPADRRPLERFLTWSMRARGGALPVERVGH
jgi:hypothetical protein